jgi:hypothetical protein
MFLLVLYRVRLGQLLDHLGVAGRDYDFSKNRRLE